MKKPEKHTVSHYDYHECARYIEHKLGIDLRDVLGMFADGKVNDVEYQDFWHCIVANNEVSNGGYIWILSEQQWPEWAIPIVEAFEEEFGLEHYWVDW